MKVEVPVFIRST